MNIVDPVLAAEFEAHMRAQYPRAIESHGVAFVAEYAEEFIEWLKTRKPPTFDEFEEHLREMSVIKVSHPHFENIGDGLLEAADRLARMREDVARLDWLIANHAMVGEAIRVGSLSKHYFITHPFHGGPRQGHFGTPREAIDNARKEVP